MGGYKRMLQGTCQSHPWPNGHSEKVANIINQYQRGCAMSKKNWISVKRGLSEDPKHRQAMGDAIWLFLHIIDAADWEKGIVYDWRDADIANDMSMNPRTVRDWRERLTKFGYIACIRRAHGLDIVIHNWTDPRTYSGKVLNKYQTDTVVSVSEEKEKEIDTVIDTQIDTVIDTVIIQTPIAKPTSFIESKSISTSTSKSALSFSELEKANKKVDYILENERKAKESWNGRGQMPEPIRELLDVYVEVTGQKPIKAKLMDWLQSGQEWLELGATPQDIQEAYKKAHPEKGDGFMVSRPGSLTNTIGMIVGERHHHGMSVQADPFAALNAYKERINKHVETV
jgi:DNA-binding protein H-NS